MNRAKSRASKWCKPNSWKPGESIRAAPRSAPSQYQWVLVVVCRPLCKAFEISPVAACALGTKRLTKVLLPAPEGPKIKVVFPCNWAISSSSPAPLFSDKPKVFSPICRYGSNRCHAIANAAPRSDLLTTSKGEMPCAWHAMSARAIWSCEKSGSAATNTNT